MDELLGLVLGVISGATVGILLTVILFPRWLAHKGFSETDIANAELRREREVELLERLP